MALIVVPPSPINLIDFNVGAAAAIGFMVPLSAQLDLSIFGTFGLGALQADLSVQFSAALSLNATLSISISNPIAAFQAALSAIVQVTANIQLAIQFGIPTIGIAITASISASAALSASLSIKLGGISALIEAAIKIKISVGQFIGELSAALSAGPIDLLAFGFDAPIAAADVGIQAATLFGSGLPGILPTDDVFGIMLVSKAPSAKTAMSFLFKTS